MKLLDPSTVNGSARISIADLAPADAPPAPQPAINVRTLLIGSAFVCLVCGLTPYNDYVVANSFIVGSFLPVILILAFFLLIVCINAPLHRFAPARALRTGELGVILVMMLVSCSIPGQGLMRSFLPTLVAPFYHGQNNPAFWTAFTKMQLPAWLFPVSDVLAGRNDSNVFRFYGHTIPGLSTPYAAWLIPLAGWGVFIAAMWTALIALASILRTQWAVNERLAFPLAQLEYSLIEAPEPGNAFNELFRSRAFWVGCVAVILIESFWALNIYFPRYVPPIPLGYNLWGVLSDSPWVYLSGAVKGNKIFFTFVGVMYFIPARTGFSLWACFLVVVLLGAGQQYMYQSEIPYAAWQDQHLGASVAWAIGLIWVGRHQWMKVIRHLLKGRSPKELVSYRGPAIALVAGVIGMIGWLLAVGVQPMMVLLIVGTLMLAHFIVARVVAETGLPIVRSLVTPAPIYTAIATPAMLTGRDVFFAGAFTSMGAFTTRESVLAFSQHGLQVADQSAGWVSRGKILAVIAWAMTLGFIVASAASLHAYYTYSIPLTSQMPDPMINKFGLDDLPTQSIVDPVTQHAAGQFPPKSHSPLKHFAIGAGVMAALQFCSLRFIGWPIAPVGYLVATSPFIGWIWWSVLLGWLAKVLILRLGGASMFKAARPLFVGLIFGEALATGLWLVINLLLVSAHREYIPIRFLPT